MMLNQGGGRAGLPDVHSALRRLLLLHLCWPQQGCQPLQGRVSGRGCSPLLLAGASKAAVSRLFSTQERCQVAVCVGVWTPSSAPLLAGAASVVGTKMVPNCCMAEPLEAGLFSHVYLCAGLFSLCSTRKWRQLRRVAEPLGDDSLLRSFPPRLCAGRGNLAGGRGAALLGAGLPALCLAASSAHPAGTCCGLRQGGASGRGIAPPLLSESPAVGLAVSAPPTGGGELVPAAVGRPSPDDDINTMPFTTVLSAQIAQW